MTRTRKPEASLNDVGTCSLITTVQFNEDSVTRLEYATARVVLVVDAKFLVIHTIASNLGPWNLHHSFNDPNQEAYGFAQ
jgi:hypothetical protein